MGAVGRQDIYRRLKWSAVVFAIGIGFGSAAVFTYAHLLATFWSRFQDSFISPPHINVTWFSWLSAVTEIGTGIVFGAVGIQALRHRTRGGDVSATSAAAALSEPMR